ncbi:MAG TPA: PAS domain-containing protein [Gaiellaceae bacterium]|nr:PAS domain-containing protein [Gaiellaceae bacterium]
MTDRGVIGPVGIVLLLGTFGLGLLIDDPLEPSAVAYSIPVALVALGFGPYAGAAAGAAGGAFYGFAGGYHGGGFAPPQVAYRILALIFLGTVVGALARRVTKANAVLQTSEARLSEAQRIAHVGSWEWDVRADRITWSDELFRIFGVDRESFRPTFAGYLDLLTDEDREIAAATVQRAFEEKAPFAFRHRIQRSDGTRVIDSAGDVVVEDGGVVRMAGVAHDVTERVAAEEAYAAAQAEIALEQELRARAVELNDAVVQGLALARYQLGAGDTAAATESLAATLERAKELVSDLIGDVELEAGALRRAAAADAPR